MYSARPKRQRRSMSWDRNPRCDLFQCMTGRCYTIESQFWRHTPMNPVTTARRAHRNTGITTRSR